MPFTFHFVFRGLSAFAFDRSLKDRETPPKKAIVLLPNLLKPRLLSRTKEVFIDGRSVQEPQVLDAHFPLLLFKKDEVRANLQSDLSDSNGYEAFRLNETSIDFLPDGSGNTDLDLTLGAIDPSVDPSTNPANNRSLEWLVEVEEVAPGYGELEPSLLKHDPPSIASDLVTRVNLSGGTLEAGGWSLQPVMIHPAKADKTFVNRHIARQLVLVVKAESHVDLQMTRYLKDPLRLSLTPQNPNDTDPVTIYIQNLECDMTLGPSTYIGLKPEADFEIFFRLSKNQISFPGIKPTPLVLTSVRGGSPFSGNSGMCPPGSFRTTGL